MSCAEICWQGLSNISWAYAKLGAEVTVEVRCLLEALAVEAVSQLMDMKSRQKFIPQNLANLVYGGYHHRQPVLRVSHRRRCSGRSARRVRERQHGACMMRPELCTAWGARRRC